MAVTPPRKAARGREQDTLIVYLMLTGNATLTSFEYHDLTKNTANRFHQASGSLTSAMRRAAENINTPLLERKCRSTTGRGLQALGTLVLAVGAAHPERLRFLGQHSWARIDGGNAVFGVAESFPGLLGEILGLRLPQPGELLTQGLSFAEISSADGAVHRVWAPLSGTVIESNVEIGHAPDLVDRLPFSSGWLTRVVLSALEEQQDALTVRTGTLAGPAAQGGGRKEKRWSF